jgi:hypothetical protein
MTSIIRTVAALTIAGAVFGAPIARANTADQQYLGALAAMGINGDPAALIAGAHSVCDLIGTMTVSMFGLNPATSQLLGAGVPYAQLRQASIAGARVYCPDKLHSLGLS